MNPSAARRLFVLDTSVLLHDPAALFRFREHSIYLSLAVLRELDAMKRGASEEARNARQASRFLDDLLSGLGPTELDTGAPLPGEEGGRLYFIHDADSAARRGDDAILENAGRLRRDQPDAEVVLVSKDINLRIQATVLGLHAEDYESDRVLDDVELLYTGLREISPESLERLADGGLRLRQPLADGYPNEFLYTADDRAEGRLAAGADEVGLRPVRDYRTGAENVWGVHARNREQNFALDLLMDPDVDFVTLLGAAGTGKTLLTLAAGLSQTFDSGRYREIIMTRSTVAIGEDIGFLPGTEEEKMTPWMGALMDNLEVLGEPESPGGRWAQAATQDVLRSRIRIRSLNFMRGRTFLDRFIILDEAQNLTAKQMKTLITRAGPGTKVVCLGNIAQIDTPYLTGTTSGLTYTVDRFRPWAHGGHVTLRRGERSRLADYASDHL